MNRHRRLSCSVETCDLLSFNKEDKRKSASQYDLQIMLKLFEHMWVYIFQLHSCKERTLSLVCSVQRGRKKEEWNYVRNLSLVNEPRNACLPVARHFIFRWGFPALFLYLENWNNWTVTLNIFFFLSLMMNQLMYQSWASNVYFQLRMRHILFHVQQTFQTCSPKPNSGFCQPISSVFLLFTIIIPSLYPIHQKILLLPPSKCFPQPSATALVQDSMISFPDYGNQAPTGLPKIYSLRPAASQIGLQVL